MIDLQSSLESIIAEFGADSGTIHMLEEDGVMHLKAAHGVPEFVLNMVRLVPVGKGMAGLALQRAEPITACNIQTDSSGDVRPGAKATGMEGAIVVPMFIGAKAVGTLGIANRVERIFSEDEQARLIAHGRVLANG